MWLQNALGLVLAGGLGGFLYLQKRETTKTVDEYSGKLSKSQEAVNSLRAEVRRRCFPCSPLRIAEREGMTMTSTVSCD